MKTTSQNKTELAKPKAYDWKEVRRLLWDDDEHILLAGNPKVTRPLLQASEVTEQPDKQFCCANSFKPNTSRKKDNIQHWHTWVIEFDDIPLEAQRELLERSYLPHTLRVFSGNKSIHTFIRSESDLTPREWKKISEGLKVAFPEADMKVLSDSSRLCRTPGGTRRDGTGQTIEYLGQRVPIKAIRQWLGREKCYRVVRVTETTETIEAIEKEKKEKAVTPNFERLTPEEVVLKTLPHRKGERNRRVFDLARGLKFNADLAGADMADLKPLVREWHKQALDTIGTKEFDDTWADFVNGWETAHDPLGVELYRFAWEMITSEELPEESMAYDKKPVRLLVALCRKMGELSGNGRFFLSSHVAGRLLELHPPQARRYMKMLEADSLIKTIKKGNQVLATRYKWISTA